MVGILQTLFPAENFALIAVILAMPLLGAIVNGIWGNRLGKKAVRLMALVAVGASFVAAVLSFFVLDKLHEGEGANPRLVWTAWEWMHTNGGRGGVNIPIDLRFSIDSLSGV